MELTKLQQLQKRGSTGPGVFLNLKNTLITKSDFHHESYSSWDINFQTMSYGITGTAQKLSSYLNKSQKCEKYLWIILKRKCWCNIRFDVLLGNHKKERKVTVYIVVGMYFFNIVHVRLQIQQLPKWVKPITREEQRSSGTQAAAAKRAKLTDILQDILHHLWPMMLMLGTVRRTRRGRR